MLYNEKTENVDADEDIKWSETLVCCWHEFEYRKKFDIKY
jgi:hypothetical protein